MTAISLFAPRRLVLLLVVTFLSLLCVCCLWEDIRYSYVPTLTTADSLDEYWHRRVSVIGKYEPSHNESAPTLGFVYFRDERVAFFALEERYFRDLKDGDIVCVTGHVICLDSPPPFHHTLTRATVYKNY